MVSSKWKESEDVLRFYGCNMEISNIETPEAFRKIENFQLRFGYVKKIDYFEKNKSGKLEFSGNPKILYKFTSKSQHTLESGLADYIQRENFKNFGNYCRYILHCDIGEIIILKFLLKGKNGNSKKS